MEPLADGAGPRSGSCDPMFVEGWDVFGDVPRMDSADATAGNGITEGRTGSDRRVMKHSPVMGSTVVWIGLERIARRLSNRILYNAKRTGTEDLVSSSHMTTGHDPANLTG